MKGITDGAVRDMLRVEAVLIGRVRREDLLGRKRIECLQPSLDSPPSQDPP